MRTAAEMAKVLMELEKGRRAKLKSGYVFVRAPNHPNAYKCGLLYEHTFMMVAYLGRPLRKGECVHHKNGIRDDNRIENLKLRSRGHPGPGNSTSIRRTVGRCVKYLQKHAPELLR